MLRETVRRLGRSPGYAALVVATLGLGVGASTAVYSVVGSLLVRPLSYPDSDRLVRLIYIFEDSRTGASNSFTELGVAVVRDLNVHLRRLSDIAGYATAEMTVTGVDRSFRLPGTKATTVAAWRRALMRRKLGVIQALMTNAPILVLDERTSGLDRLM